MSRTQGTRLFLAVVLMLCVFPGLVFLPVPAAAPPVTALTFGADGRFLFATGDKSVTVRSVANDEGRVGLPCKMPKITALSVSPNGQYLAVGGGTPGETGILQIWDWKNLRQLSQWETFDDLVMSAVFSPDGEHVAVASADHTARVVRFDPKVSQMESAFVLTDHSGPVLAVAYSPSGKILVTGSADRTLKVWDAESGRILRTLGNHTAPIHCVTFRPASPNLASDAVFCASGGDDQTVRIWQPDLGRMVRIIRQHAGPIFALAYSRDGTRLISAGKEGAVRLIAADGDVILQEWAAHPDWIYALAISPDGNLLATGDWMGSIKLWDLRVAGIREVSGGANPPRR